LRHLSRWLNAASLEVDADKLGVLAALPYVRKIDPVIGREYVPVEVGPTVKERSAVGPEPAGTSVLNYGSSLNQLTQINVPAVHELGYNGQGVIVCMLDTGYRKDHQAFQAAYNEGRVLAERDFVFNDFNTQDEPEDQPGQHNHGTYIWSALGGLADGSLYGPAYGAQFILGKTEDIRSETEVEEDNWLAGVEWADSIGASVISSSLVYKDWYVYADYTGDICVITVAADLAASLGIVVCNAMGNYGPAAGTFGAPADADSILSIGAVNSVGDIAGFSSRGPTFDGRIKPEVCAQGVSTACASPNAPTLFTTASGTSLSTPLVGGCAAVLLSAHPLWTPMQVREALMMTASQAGSPDNDYGRGIVDLLAALNYGPDPGYIPGDLNYDAEINILDIALEIDIVFFGTVFPLPPVSPDINLDGLVGTPDIVMMIDYVFRGGDAPPFPPA
jgi:subtilisin family serine protease